MPERFSTLTLACLIGLQVMGALAAQDVQPVPIEDQVQARLQVPVPGPMALVGGTLYPMAEGLNSMEATLIVRGGKIESILPAGSEDVVGSLPADVRVIDVTGQFVVPGLMDGAVNYDPAHDALYLSAGVTLVRDTGNDVSLMLTERLAPARARTPGPALVIAGPILDSSTTSSADALVLADGPSATARLTQLIETMDARAQVLGLTSEQMRPDYLAFHAGLGRDAWEAVIHWAHSNPAWTKPLAVWGPLPTGVSLSDAIQVGQDGLLGLHGLLPEGTPWEQARHDQLAPAIATLAQSALGVTPMLGVLGRVLTDTSDAGELAMGLPYLSPTYAQLWRQQALVWKVQREGGDLDGLALRALAAQRRALLELWRGGAKLVPGSGTPNPWIAPGAGLLLEFDQWTRAGVAPLEVLRLATAGAADQMDNSRGRLLVGKVADFVILPRDPALGLNVLKEPSAVVVRGQYLDAQALAGIREQVLDRQTQARERLAAPLEISPIELPEGDVILSGSARKLAYGERVSAEKYAVVRTFDGGVTFLSHAVHPGADGSVLTDVYLTQVFRERVLQSFRLRVDVRGRPDLAILAEGTLVGTSTRMAVRRRDEKGILDTVATQEAISIVDGSDMLTALILGQYAPVGPFFALSLEGPRLVPGVDRWQMQQQPTDKGLHVRTSRGRMAMALGSDGTPVAFQRRVGSGITELDVTEVETFGGPGLVPADGRVFVPPADDTTAPSLESGEPIQQEGGETEVKDEDSQARPVEVGGGGRGSQPEQGNAGGDSPDRIPTP